MAATPAQIRAGIVTALTNGLGATGQQVSAYRLEAPTDKCLQVIGTDTVEYDTAMQRGLDVWTFQVQALAGTPISQEAQTLLDQWKEPSGSNSVKTAIESDITLGGIVASARVARASGDTVYSFAPHGDLLGCVFDVVVHAGK